MERQDPGQNILAWEDAKGFLGSLKPCVLACGSFLFRPVETYRQLGVLDGVDIKKRVLRSVIFAVVFGYVKLFFDALNLYWLKYMAKDVFSQAASPLSLLSSPNFASPFYLLRPLIVLGFTFLLVAVSVKLILGFQRPLLLAWLVVCYKSAADIFYCIPFLGSILALVWSFMLIFVGIREMYKIDTARSLIAAIVMPFLILFSMFLSFGPFLNRFITSVYPEIRTQVTKLNDMTVYSNTVSIVSGIQKYKKQLGFYPAHIGVVKKYLIDSPVDDSILTFGIAAGYIYRYSNPDESHFILEVVPQKTDLSGQFILFADETGVIRLDGRLGKEIKNTQDFNDILLSK